ncbi:hypothetical protein [Rufibacter tibetensis]|uniref:hypothetical protein n=1 Tax=Rufibacter tibetensis TaxID=512763 RepID=UPI0007853213|nr:hypothetical protein [Rufibacter tibetensis]
MKQSQPYKRIIRPFSLPDLYTIGYNSQSNYIADDRYASDRFEIIRAYHILEKDVVHLFEFIEPSDANLRTYSYRVYKLFLRAATEFELNSKKILSANGYARTGNWNVTDYYKINAATRLSEYRLFINIWGNGKKEINPFSEWAAGHSLSWYQDYNSVKHNRHDEFARASLGNLLNALGAVFSVVFAQFHNFIFTQYQPNMGFHSDDDTNELSSENTLFSIILPQSWTEQEMYNFDWSALRTDAAPFQDYAF